MSVCLTKLPYLRFTIEGGRIRINKELGSVKRWHSSVRFTFENKSIQSIQNSNAPSTAATKASNTTMTPKTKKHVQVLSTPKHRKCSKKLLLGRSASPEDEEDEHNKAEKGVESAPPDPDKDTLSVPMWLEPLIDQESEEDVWGKLHCYGVDSD